MKKLNNGWLCDTISIVLFSGQLLCLNSEEQSENAIL